MKKALSVILAMVLTLCMLVPLTAQAANKPAATKITSLKSTSSSITVKWEKRKVQGYQVMYSTSSDFNNAKKVNIKKAATVSKTVKKLKSGKKYYVKVRTFKTVNGKKKFSKFTKTKSISTKSAAKKKTSKSSKRGNTVYIYPTGKKYHNNPNCSGSNSSPVSLSDAEAYGYTPCKKCANG